jgi:putative toxin-antitoxin system antitoxin component (TIGR02293 family)
MRKLVRRVSKTGGFITREYKESKVKESDPETYGSLRITTLTHWLGLSQAASKLVISDFDVIKLGIIGITKSSINSLASYIGISKKYITENIFDISVKTLERKDNKTKLDKKTSSHAVEIAKVLQHGYEVFRDEEKLKHWLNRENKALNDFRPVELFDTLSGLSMVNDILGRIEEGVYS